MDYQDTIDEGNISLGDTNNVTFTVEEKQRAFTKAWNDSFVVSEVWDETLTFTQGVYQYALPTGVSNIQDIYVRTSNDTMTEPEKINKNLWEVVDGNLQFKNNANNYIPDSYTLYLKAKKKLDKDTDTLDTPALQEYVIALGCYHTLGLLGYKKANLFLKNDTSMSELISLKREMEREVKEFRSRLPRDFVSV